MNASTARQPGDGGPAPEPPGAGWRGLAAGVPDASALAVLEGAAPADLSPGEVVDAIVTAERLISHVQAMQARLLTDLARPGRAGDVTRLVGVLVGRGGAGRDPVSGEVDPELVAFEVGRQARSLAAAEVAAALCVPHRTASCRIDRAVELVDELPATWAALGSGRLDERRARLIADGTRVLPPGVRAAVEAAIVPLAGTRVSSRVQELLDRAVIAADPDAAAALEHQARSERTVVHRPGRHGVGHVNATLPAEGAVTVFTLLDLLAQATGTPGDGRGIDARRADALVDICAELLTCGRLDLTGGDPPDVDVDVDDGDEDDPPDEPDAEPAAGPAAGPAAEPAGTGRAAGTGSGHEPGSSSASPAPAPSASSASSSSDSPSGSSSGRSWRGLSRHGRRPHLSVTVGLSTLAGLDRLPGHLAGHGAITAELATNLARAAGTMNLIGVHPETGTAAAVGQTVYRPGRQLLDQIAAAAGTCRFPSCNQPAWRCDTDHRHRFDHDHPESGGLTRLWDCDPECRRHHLLKTHAHWQAARGDGDDPTVEWTSPTGHHYTDRPREFTIPGEQIDPWLAEIFTPARQAPSPPPPVDPTPTGDASGPGRAEQDLHRVDGIRRRIETLRWQQRREHTLSRLAVLTRPPTAAQIETRTNDSDLDSDIDSDIDSDLDAESAPDLDAESAPDRDGDVNRSHPRRRTHDPDYRARLAIERAAREAAGIPDDPPPF